MEKGYEVLSNYNRVPNRLFEFAKYGEKRYNKACLYGMLLGICLAYHIWLWVDDADVVRILASAGVCGLLVVEVVSSLSEAICFRKLVAKSQFDRSVERHGMTN